MWCDVKFLRDYKIRVVFSDGRVKEFEKVGSIMLDNFLISFCIHEIEGFELSKVFLDVYKGILYIDNVLYVEECEFMITSNFVISITKLNKKDCL